METKQREPREVELTRADVMVVQPQTEQFGFLPYFGRRVKKADEVAYLPLEEIKVHLSKCAKLDQGRMLTAILRVSREQLDYRARFDPTKTVAMYSLGAGVGCLILSVTSSTPVLGIFPAMLPLVLGLVNASWLWKNRVLVRLYRQESDAVREAACTAISQLAVHCHYPKRLYKDDVRMLRKLQKGSPHFAKLVKAILANSAS